MGYSILIQEPKAFDKPVKKKAAAKKAAPKKVAKKK